MTQLRLLRFLQERTFYPVGSDTPIVVDTRIITATNVDLKEKVQDGSFREDLYFRLKVIDLTLPPLRKRMDDVPLLVDHFIRKFSSAMEKKLHGISDNALSMLNSYHWPGNVRELEQAVRSILLKRHYYGDAMVTDTDPEDKFAQGFYTGTLEAKELLKQYCTILYKRYGTYEEVARRANLDPRTVKKHLSHNTK